MCGIFGVITSERSQLSPAAIESLTKDLFLLSESRGKEAAGLSILNGNTLQVLKRPIPASQFIRTKEFQTVFEGLTNGGGSNAPMKTPVGIIGHSRLATNGTRDSHLNNQPVIAGGMVGIHNGIIVNDEALWKQFPELKRNSVLDTEVMLSLARKFIESGDSIIEALQRVFTTVEGAASVAFLFEDYDCLFLGTNTGSLYLYASPSEQTYLFASERYILETLINRRAVKSVVGDGSITQIRPGEGCLLELSSFELHRFALPREGATKQNGSLPYPIIPVSKKRPIVDVNPPAPVAVDTGARVVNPGGPIAAVTVEKELLDHVELCTRGISHLKRCTKCVLPETMPFIDFDSQGVCSYCREYTPINPKGAEALAVEAAQFRGKNNDRPDCIVSLSGGRDSTYGLHYVKTVLGLNPITYTYDWGMVTDLARRNIARICGKLGVEHILVSADLNKKRANIRKNLSAWLKRPHLGIIPLLMAGDKQFFYHGERLRKQCGVDLVVLCDNLLEKTNFKTGFCGVPPTSKQTVYRIPLASRIQLAAFYGKEFITNPAFLNSSMLDTVSAYGSYYVIKHHVLSLFNYLPWDETSMTKTLIEEYDWELAKDTTSTWRIGDGTAAFYNYAYFVAAGFTENDTFRSNQIREGMISREQAMSKIEVENQPRWESLQWYCDVVGVDWRQAIRTINKMEKHYAV